MGMGKYKQDLRKIKKLLKTFKCQLKIDDSKATQHDVAFLNTFKNGTSKITLYSREMKGKKFMILTLLHECAHAYVHYLDICKYKKPLNKMQHIPFKKLTKKQRKIIYKSELDDLVYMFEVWALADIKSVTPGEILDRAIDDLSVYRYFSKKGKYPTAERNRVEMRKFVKSKEFKNFIKLGGV